MFLASGFGLVLLSILAFILILGTIIILHEAGHFFFAKKAGVYCHEFSIGMGPLIYKKQFGETQFSIRLIPFGGYVAMADDQMDTLIKVGDKIGVNTDGEQITEIILDDKRECELRLEVEAIDISGKAGQGLYITLKDDLQNHFYKVKENADLVFEKNKRLRITPYDRCVDSKTLWQRFLIFFAGPMMNFVLSMFVYFIVSFSVGVPNTASNKIAAVDNYFEVAEDSFYQKGDRITGIKAQADTDYTDVSSWKEFSHQMDVLKDNYVTSYTVRVDRKGEIKSFDVEAITVINSIGISNVGVKINESKLSTIPNTTIEGLKLGNVAIRYKSKKGDIKAGDYITKVKIGQEVFESDVLSWSFLVEKLSNINVEDIKFEYYTPIIDESGNKTDNYKLVTLEECKTIEPYTNEVLSSQNIEKITVRIGVTCSSKFDLFGCIGNAFVMFWDDFTLIFKTLKLLIAPSQVRQIGIQNMSGAVGIFAMIKNLIGQGFITLLAFSAMLSVNIGIVNLLPIPALDGGRLVFLLYELIARRKPNKKVENIINNTFYIILLLFFLYVTFNDILRFF